ncbi:LexA family protein [Vreelandella zhaodongensis]|uniref:LexA family protein n=1 Tax=Vreelandella zhaodongensis TaxID=1176240 RepID=UPI003EB88878
MTMSMPLPSLAAHQGLSQGVAQSPSQVSTSATRQAYPAPRVTRRNTYALRVRGDRMRECNLFDGDVIIIRRHQHGSHQETAIATINQREVALKQLSISRLGVHLWPEDAAIPAVFLHNCDIQVLGMVMGVEHHAKHSQHH